MDGFLAEGLTRLASLSDAERTELRNGFDRAMALNRKLFTDHAFRKSLASTDPAPSRSVINISLFEVCAVTMFGLELDLDTQILSRLRDAVINLVRDDKFSDGITYSTNSTRQVQFRFDAMENAVAIARFL
jgi:hypothetical protein